MARIFLKGKGVILIGFGLQNNLNDVYAIFVIQRVR